MFVLKSNIPIGAITEISPKGFTIGVKVEKNKIKFMVLIDPKAQNRYLSTQEANCIPWGQCGCNKILLFDEIYFENLNKP